MSTPSLLDTAVEKPNGQIQMPPDVAAFINVIERASANPEFDADKLEKLLAMYERIMDRNAERAFNMAFAEMQARLPVITEHGKIEVNGVVRSEYAHFEDINDVLKPLLSEYGFGLMFKVKAAKDTVSVTPMLIHKDGYREVGESMELGADTSGSKNSVQAMGSSTSYAKRYTLIPFLNITTRGEDDDGYAGGARLIDENQQANIQALLDETKYPKDKLLKWVSTKVKRQLTALNQIPESQYRDVIAGLEKKRNAPPERGGK